MPRFLLLSLLVGSCLMASACGRSGQPAPVESLVVESLVNADRERPAGVMVLWLVEEHTDSFPRRLSSAAPDPGPVPFDVEDGEVILFDAAADVIAADKLRDFDLALGSKDVPLSRCKVLVIYSTLHNGTGRVWDEHRYFGFESLPIRIEVPKPARFDRFEFDFGRSDQPFPLAAQKVRIFEKEPGKVEIKLGENDKVEVVFNEAATLLAAKASAVLAEARRAIPVVEAAIVADSINPGEPALELQPKIDHGRISFSTKLSITYLGVLPVRKSAPKPMEEPLP